MTTSLLERITIDPYYPCLPLRQCYSRHKHVVKTRWLDIFFRVMEISGFEPLTP
jgi:hypothetical protein